MVPGTTAAPDFCNVPELTVSTRKWITLESTSASLAAAASASYVIANGVFFNPPDKTAIALSVGASFTGTTVRYFIADP